MCNPVGMARDSRRTRESAPRRNDRYVEEEAWHCNGWEDSFLSFFSRIVISIILRTEPPWRTHMDSNVIWYLLANYLHVFFLFIVCISQER